MAASVAPRWSASASARAREARNVSPPDSVRAGRVWDALVWSTTRNPPAAGVHRQRVCPAGELAQDLGRAVDELLDRLVEQPLLEPVGGKVTGERLGDLLLLDRSPTVCAELLGLGHVGVDAAEVGLGPGMGCGHRLARPRPALTAPPPRPVAEPAVWRHLDPGVAAEPRELVEE